MVKRLRWCHDIELLGQRSSTGADTSGPFLMAACCPSQPAENLPFAFHLQTLPFPQACRDFSFKITASSQLRLSEVGRADIAVWDHSAFNCYCLLIKINCGHQGGRKSHMILVFSFRWFFFPVRRDLSQPGRLLADDLKRVVLGCFGRVLLVLYSPLHVCPPSPWLGRSVRGVNHCS